MTRIKAEFTVADNEDKRFSEEDIKVKFRNDTQVSRVWVMSFEDLVELQTTIQTFMAGERG